MNKDAEKLVRKYLDKIKKNLPDWIKDNKEKLEDLELEISSHIWDSAYEIAGSDDPDVVSVQKAINQMGPPKDIAKSYKTRGTPKHFISEELWSSYKKVIFSIVSVVFLIIVVVQVVIVEPNDIIQAIINTVTLSVNAISIFFIIITIIFTYLSAEGFFPEDFNKKGQFKDEKEKFQSQYYKPGEFLFNGIAGVVFGLIFVILPKDIFGLFRVVINWIVTIITPLGTPNYSDFVLPFELQLWLVLGGIMIIIRGIGNLMKIQTKDPGFHIGMNVLDLFTKMGDLILVIYVWTKLSLLMEVLPQLSETILIVMLALGIIGNIVDIFGTLRKMYFLFDLKYNSNPFAT